MLKIQFLFIAWFFRRFLGQQNNDLSNVYTYDGASKWSLITITAAAREAWRCVATRLVRDYSHAGSASTGGGTATAVRAPYRTSSQLSNTSIDTRCQTLFAESLTFFTGRGIEAWLAVPP